MRNLVLHRWAVVFLIVSRLIAGEFAHAMPHSDAAGATVATFSVQTAAACPDHEGTSPAAQSSLDPSQSLHGVQDDCCKAKGCKCPCVHLPSAASDAFTLEVSHRGLHRMSEPAPGVAMSRPSALFRPPA